MNAVRWLYTKVMSRTVLLVVSLCLVSVSGLRTHKPVSTLLRSYWPQTSLVLEASEFMYDYDELTFWKFVDGVRDIDLSTQTDKEVYDVVLDVSEALLPPTHYSLFILSLSLRTHSPAVEMFNQIAMERLNLLGAVDCPAFVEFKGRLYCSVEDIDLNLSDENESPVYSFDHIYPGSDDNVTMAILYGQLGTPHFNSIHVAMETLAQEGRLQYVLRHYETDRPTKGILLSGYGVELAVKNTEYKAMDDSKVKEEVSRSVEQNDVDGEDVEGFVFNTLRSLHPELTDGLEEFRTHLKLSVRELPELKLWQLQDLGFQACQRVMSSSAQLTLKVLKDTAQNAPMQAKSLYKLQVNKEMRKEIKANQKVLSKVGVSAGDNVLMLDGIVIQNERTDIYQLMDVLMSESRLLEGFSSLAINQIHHLSLLALPIQTSESNVFAVDVRNDSVVMFINDLETDRQYKLWPKALREFLQPAYPGTLRQVARNVFNIVFMFDPTTSDGREMIEYVSLFLHHNVPVRLGVVLLPSNDVGTSISQGFDYLTENKSSREAFKWLVKTVGVENVSALFEHKYKAELPESNGLTERSLDFFKSKGFDNSPQVLLNGVQLDLSEDLETAIVSNMQRQMYPIQQDIFTKKLTEKMNVYDYLLNKSNVLQRLNKHVVSRGNQIDLSETVPSVRTHLSDRELSALIASRLNYYSCKQGEFTTKELSLWVIGDFTILQTRQVALEALQFASHSDRVRVALLPTSLASLLTLGNVWPFILHILSFDTHIDDELIWRLATEQNITIDRGSVDDVIRDHVSFVSQVLDMSPDTTAIVANGRLIGPLGPNEKFVEADFEMLLSVESSSYTSQLVENVAALEINGLEVDGDTTSFRSDLLMKLASLLLSQPKQRRMTTLPDIHTTHSVVHLPASDDRLHMNIMAILNPLSSEAQKLVPLLQVLQVALPVDLTIVLNPSSKLTQMPVNSFYRYVVEPELSFSLEGEVLPPVAVFNDLPQSALLTLHLDVPHSWLVEAVWSPHDLDNIHLDAVTVSGVHADFELKNILVEGQCFESGTDRPVAGLEYVLGTASHPQVFDTIVMANLGYFQLKAGPGVWAVTLRDGRSRLIYAIQSHVGGDNIGKSPVGVTIRSFRGAGVVIYVVKQPGMESAHLLTSEEPTSSDGDSEGNIWDSISSLIGGVADKPTAVESVGVAQNETINIFSVASGHLYERFLRIMMLSVLKHTDNPVKFWFLKNFLSPTFKDFIPKMAGRYGFEYELVEYKWPRWLHAQTQKQRIIWGYKILFLDVLFPLSVKKIIFVDADQIVRTNLRELLEVPLDGAPYAYTPFCDSRPDMAGFRFWDSGYWKNHLGNRRYHISALYVIDLLRFRQLAAGDRLRGQYQALSQDPNSLSNLDQDLPNNMIHAVPIKSLSQEWLWCETWCSMESKERAKTIDLCNNPLTKEPKLEAAVRIVPEWTGYDLEIKELMETSSDKQRHTHTEL